MIDNINQESQPVSRDIALLNRFNDALNRRDIPTAMLMMTDDCVFDNTFPAPDGKRYEGQAAVRQAWEEFFENSPDAHFEIEEMFTSGDRAVQRWVYNWTDTKGEQGHVRGVDVFRFRDGKIAEKLSYVKG
jgi:steroid delta-isomerase-like uncharacterized protein